MNEGYYVERDGVPVAVDLPTWGREFRLENRVVARDELATGTISTVFLGLDHSFGHGEPILYETMVFGGELDQEQVRYCTREEALAGHVEMVERVRATGCE